MYSSALSFTSKIDGDGGQHYDPGISPPGMTWYPLYRRPGGSQCQAGWVQKFRPPGIRSLDHPANEDSLYQICYPRPKTLNITNIKVCLCIWY